MKKYTLLSLLILPFFLLFFVQNSVAQSSKQGAGTNNYNSHKVSRALITMDCASPIFITCPGASTNQVLGICGAIVTYDPVINNVQNANIAYTFEGATLGNGNGTGSGSIFNIGTTSITIIATNACGKAKCNFTITVKDKESPKAICLGNLTKLIENGFNTYSALGTEFDPAFDDNCSGSTILNDYTNSSSLANAVFPIGVTKVTWTITDAANNKTSCSFEVNIMDISNPVGKFKDLSLKINCSPNPFTQSFKMNYTSQSKSNVVISVYGIAGNCIEKIQLTGYSNETELGNNLPDGIYTVTFTQDSVMKTFKMIKVN